MRPETIEKYNKAVAMIAEGKTFDQTLKALSMGSQSFYKVRDSLKKAAVKPTTKPVVKMKAAKFVDLPPTAARADKLAIIICEPGQIAAVIAGLK